MSETLLWTRTPRVDTIAASRSLDVFLVISQALEYSTVADAAIIRSFSTGADLLVITSSHAVTALIDHQCVDILQTVPSVAVGEHTSELIQSLGGTVVATAASAIDLMHRFSHAFTRGARYFSGERISLDLGIPRLPVYRTRLLTPIAPDVDATALFSPLSVRSMLTPVNNGRLGALGAIGPTTADAIKTLGATPSVVSTEANETTLLIQLVEFLRSS